MHSITLSFSNPNRLPYDFSFAFYSLFTVLFWLVFCLLLPFCMMVIASFESTFINQENGNCAEIKARIFNIIPIATRTRIKSSQHRFSHTFWMNWKCSSHDINQDSFFLLWLCFDISLRLKKFKLEFCVKVVTKKKKFPKKSVTNMRIPRKKLESNVSNNFPMHMHLYG